MSWANQDIITQEIVENKEGFVYKITNLETGMIYYGIKKFKRAIRRKPLKGKKRIRRDTVESDWKTYNTSSPQLSLDLQKRPAIYKKEIVRVCDTLTELKAYEAYYQLSEYVNGNWSKLINEVINLRLRIRK